MNGMAHMHRPETVALVEKTAAELGYRRNLLARGMLTGKSLTVGVMLPYYVNREFNTGILEGIQSELLKHDYLAILITVDGSSLDIAHSHKLIERRVDGVIFRPHPYGESDTYLKELVNHRIPVVSVVDVEQSIDQPTDFVGVDEAMLGKRAAEHLLALGHRRIGFTRIGEARFDVPLKVRFDAFKAAVLAAGGEILTTPLSPDPKFDQAATEQLLTSKNRPTAVFCSVDDIAFRLMEVARGLGLRIPEDLSVLGSCNYTAADFTSPKLSTFDLNTQEIGRQSAELLMRRIANAGGAKATAKMYVVPELIVRESTAKLKG